jgi:exodeoxyribonuclease V alpha subunit
MMMNDSYLQFFESLKSIKAISDIWKWVLIMLKSEYGMSDDLLKFFGLFFALIDDGNICISLDDATLKNKWVQKLAGVHQEYDAELYDKIIENGISAVKDYFATDGNYKTDEIYRNDMFVVYKNWLFTERFFSAKQDVEDGINTLFPAVPKVKIASADREYIKNKYQTMNTENRAPSDEQADAIIYANLPIERDGASTKQGGVTPKNLIITGGPGTGKTTVICNLLWELLSKKENADKKYSVYMAAFSGKAAKRIKESIMDSLNKMKPELRQERAYKIISDVQPLTIHKLLGMSNVNAHEIKQFPSDSIFVIDEASMIDVELFAKLLNVIKQPANARVFLLGDKDQLPPVQPGAVFSELTQKRKDCVIELTKNFRLAGAENTDVFKFKDWIQTEGKSEKPKTEWLDKLNLPDIVDAEKSNIVKCIRLSEESAIQSAVINWYYKFYESDAEYNKVYSDISNQSTVSEQTLDAIWQRIGYAKILCAENHGIRGTKRINNTICEYIKAKHPDIDSSGNFFVGEQIIVTKNQNLYDLSNGDIGIIVLLNGKKYMMIRREDVANKSNQAGNGIIFRIGNYMFYPLYLLPTDAVDAAYAITIHKSQGSEYHNVLVFLPESENSPLLNRQILYTAVTRTKNTVYVVSSQKNIEKAVQTADSRDTQLFL